MNPLSLLAGNRLIAYAVVAAALVVVGWQWHARGKRIDALNVTIGELTAELGQCTTQQKATDEAITTLRAAGEADRQKREAAERAAAQAATDAERRVRAALTAKVPNECSAAVAWLGDYGRTLAERWSGAK